MRSRQAWLAAMTAALGLTDGCHKGTENDPASREAPSAPRVTSTDHVAEAPLPSFSPPPASVSAASTAAPSASGVVRPPSSADEALALANAMDMIQATCGVSTQNDTLLRQPTRGGISGIGDLGSAFGDAGTTSRPQITPSITTTVSGGSPTDERAIVTLKPRFRACASRALQIDPHEQGTLRVVVSIQPSGEVASVDVTANAGLSAQSAACMTTAVRRAMFEGSPAQAGVRKVALAITQVASK